MFYLLLPNVAHRICLYGLAPILNFLFSVGVSLDCWTHNLFIFFDKDKRWWLASGRLAIPHKLGIWLVIQIVSTMSATLLRAQVLEITLKPSTCCSVHLLWWLSFWQVCQPAHPAMSSVPLGKTQELLDTLHSMQALWRLVINTYMDTTLSHF